MRREWEKSRGAVLKKKMRKTVLKDAAKKKYPEIKPKSSVRTKPSCSDLWVDTGSVD